MAQNKYSLSWKLGNPSAKGLCQIYIRIIWNGKEFKLPTNIKVDKKNFIDGKVVKLINKDDYNAALRQKWNGVEKLLLEADVQGVGVTLDYLKGNRSSNNMLHSFITRYIARRSNKNTTMNLKSILKKLPDVMFSEIDTDFLPQHEKRLRAAGLDNNTINVQVRKVKYMLADAADKGMLDGKVIASYKPPRYVQKIPEFLNEDEIESFAKVVFALGMESKKTCGYYFLLSCYTGYRLSDLKRFDYAKNCKGGKLIIRATKNGKIVSIPVYPKLGEVLTYCKIHRLSISEQNFRDYVKEISRDAGIKRNIKIHTGRHTFAMRLINKGFTIDEVAELLGDTPEVARIYARITNTHLESKIKKVLWE